MPGRVCRHCPKVDERASVAGWLVPLVGTQPATPQDAQESPQDAQNDGMAMATPKSDENRLGACPNVPQGQTDSPPADDGGEYEADGWRIESKGAGRFAFRQGGGYQRRTMRGVYLSADQLSEDQYARHKQNAAKQAGAKQHARQQRGS
jgi:hypothetical protein